MERHYLSHYRHSVKNCFPTQNFTEIGQSATELWPNRRYLEFWLFPYLVIWLSSCSKCAAVYAISSKSDDFWESANLHQRQNLKQKWSGIRIRIFGLIRIRMSVVPQTPTGALPLDPICMATHQPRLKSGRLCCLGSFAAERVLNFQNRRS